MFTYVLYHEQDAKNSSKVAYAELGKKTKNAPIHLPLELCPVTYSELRVKPLTSRMLINAA